MKKEYNYKLTISYEGSRYLGWQRLQGEQNRKTIQGILETHLSKLLGEEIIVIGSGRTDTMVHAYGQVANFHSEQVLDVFQLLCLLNQQLPRDIQVLSIEEVASQFHSRYDAKGKVYEYHLKMGTKLDVFHQTTQTLIPLHTDVNRIKEAAKLLEGTHDFAGFSSKMTDGRSTVKTIWRIEVEQGEELVLRFYGNGFLYNMIRIIVGTLVEIGCGTREIESVLTVLKTKNRQDAGRTIEANGLILKAVVY